MANPEENLSLFKPKKNSPKSLPHTAKLCFSVALKHFQGHSQRTSLFSPKMTISERSSEIHRKFVFINKFEKVEIQRKFGFVVNKLFCTNQ